jgi:hypothetical protein
MADETKPQGQGNNPQSHARTAAQPGPNQPQPQVAAAPATFTPYLAPSEIIPGGVYRRNTRQAQGKHFGGDVADANGVVLATFEDKAENTGNPADGELTEDGKAWVEKHKDLLKPAK